MGILTTGPGIPRRPSGPGFPGAPWGPIGPVFPGGPSKPASPWMQETPCLNMHWGTDPSFQRHSRISRSECNSHAQHITFSICWFSYCSLLIPDVPRKSVLPNNFTFQTCLFLLIYSKNSLCCKLSRAQSFLCLCPGRCASRACPRPSAFLRLPRQLEL